MAAEIPSEWSIRRGNEALLEHFERDWSALDPTMRADVVEFIHQAEREIPGVDVAFDFPNSGLVTVKLYLPHDHPVYDPGQPGLHLATTFGPPKPEGE
jgi:hypothetical protein